MEQHFATREAWRAWLEEHHERARAVWVVFYRKQTGIETVSYDALVEEALCFGWIDSLIKRLDDDRYARKVTPRSNTAKWSAANLARVERLKAAGRMTAAGLAKIADGVQPVPPPSRRVQEAPTELVEALAAHPPAREAFERLAPSQRRIYIGWIAEAKREETRRRRAAEAVDRLTSGEPLGMK